MEPVELVKIAKGLGAKVEPIEIHCQHQVIGQSVFEYCQRSREFGVSLGSAGGPAVMCKEHSLATGKAHKVGDTTVIEYSDSKTCPFFVEEGEIMGWKIFLPAVKK